METYENNEEAYTRSQNVKDAIRDEVLDFAMKSGISSEDMAALDAELIKACITGNVEVAQKMIFDMLINSATATAGRMMCGKGWGKNVFMASVMFGEVATFYGAPLNKVEEKSTGTMAMDPAVAELLKQADNVDPDLSLDVRLVKAYDDEGLMPVTRLSRMTVLTDRTGVSFRPITRVEHSFLLTRLSCLLARALVASHTVATDFGCFNGPGTGSYEHREQMGVVFLDNHKGMISVSVQLDCTLPDRIKRAAQKVLENLPRFKRTRDYPVSVESPCPTRLMAAYVTSGVGWRAPRATTHVSVGFYLPKTGASL